MKKSAKLLAAVAVVAACAAGVVWYLYDVPAETAQAEEATGKKVKKPYAERRREAKAQREARKREMETAASEQAVQDTASDEHVEPKVSSDPALAPFTAEDMAINDAIDKAVSDETFESTLEAVSRAFASADPRVRINAVEGLGSFGRKALPELTSALADADENVALSAQEQIEQLVMDPNNYDLEDVDDAAQFASDIARIAKTVMDKDNSEFMLDQLDQLDDERLIMETLIDVIENGNNVGQETAKAKYEDWTGEEYQSAGAARTWVNENASDLEE